MTCIPFFHKWPSLPTIKVLDVDRSTASLFGNVLLTYRCEWCGKVKTLAKFRP